MWPVLSMILAAVFVFAGIALCVAGKKKSAPPATLAGIAAITLGAYLLVPPSIGFELGVVCTGAGFVLLHQGKSGNKGKSVLLKFGGFAMILTGLITLIVLYIFGSDMGKASVEQYGKIRYIEAKKLGEYAKSNYSGKTVAVICIQDGQEAESAKMEREAFIKAFEEGCGNSVSVQKIDWLTYPPAPATADPDDHKAYQEQCNEIMRNFFGANNDGGETAYLNAISATGADVILNLAGMPVPGGRNLDIQEIIAGFMAELKEQDKVMLIPSTVNSYSMYLKDAIEQGTVALVMTRTDAGNFNDDLPDDPDAAFDTRFILVDQGNIRSVASNPDYSMYLTAAEETADAEDDYSDGEDDGEY